MTELDRSSLFPADGINGSAVEVQPHCSMCTATDAYNVLTSCLHSVCHRCLNSLKQDDSYFCSICKEYSNATINNPLLCKTETTQKSPGCNWCEDNGEHTKSIGNCKECDVWLCGECLKGHNRMPPLRSHSITMLPKSENQGSLRCSTHLNETLECFCEACGILTCRDCQLSVHRDHGSHRWVGEKANLLADPLQDAIGRLEQYQLKLLDTRQTLKSACSSTKDDSFLGSVEKARIAVEARTSSLLLRIRAHADSLLDELNKRSAAGVNQLILTETLMCEIQDRIMYTMSFANRLVENKDSDPASLVQLYDIVQSRINLLTSRAERLLNDMPPSSDAMELSKDTRHSFDPSSWRKATLGWHSTCNTRTLFVAHWNPDELARHSGAIAWLQNPPVNCSTVESSVWASKPKFAAAPPGMTADEYGEFLDSLAAIDGHPGNWSSTTDQAASCGVGCAICFGPGLLAHCGKCRRAYHLDCHLPRLSVMSLVPGWVCGLCEDQDAASAAHVEQATGTGLPRMDFLAGCRILMGLLVHAEAVHFTASVCPACSVPLLTPGRSVPHCPAGHLYHRLAELRLQLEEAASVEDGGAAPIDDLEDEDQTGADKAPKGGRIRLTRLDDWLVEVDKFWSDASNEGNHIHGATTGCLLAARRLRASLASLVKIHRPQSQVSFLTAQGTPEQFLDNSQIGTGKALFNAP